MTDAAARQVPDAHPAQHLYATYDCDFLFYWSQWRRVMARLI